MYVALLRLKKANASAIARLAHIPRQEIYRVLPRLEKSSLVEVIIGKPTRFLAVKPEDALSGLIERQQRALATKVSELRRKRDILKKELEKVEGTSVGITRSEPTQFVLVSGQRLVNEKVAEMLNKAKKEVLWMVPKFEIKQAIVYDRDKLLRKCAQRNAKVRVITEVDEKNAIEVRKLGRFCDIRHSQGVTSMMTIVDDKELIVSSARHTSEDLSTEDLIHKLWTNDSSHIGVMREFFEKVWSYSSPAN